MINTIEQVIHSLNLVNSGHDFYHKVTCDFKTKEWQYQFSLNKGSECIINQITKVPNDLYSRDDKDLLAKDFLNDLIKYLVVGAK